jgi:hypothetical protein
MFEKLVKRIFLAFWAWALEKCGTPDLALMVLTVLMLTTVGWSVVNGKTSDITAAGPSMPREC